MNIHALFAFASILHLFAYIYLFTK